MFIAGAAMWITGRKMKNHVEKSGQDEEKRREKAKKNTAKKTQIPESWKIMFDEEERDPKEYATEREKAAAEGPEAVRLQPAAVAAPPPDAAIKTEVLADFSDSGDMACLVPEDGGQRIVIEYVPFIIGKSADMADACLERKTVSCLHAVSYTHLDVYKRQALQEENAILRRKLEILQRSFDESNIGKS